MIQFACRDYYIIKVRDVSWTHNAEGPFDWWHTAEVDGHWAPSSSCPHTLHHSPRWVCRYTLLSGTLVTSPRCHGTPLSATWWWITVPVLHNQTTLFILQTAALLPACFSGSTDLMWGWRWAQGVLSLSHESWSLSTTQPPHNFHLIGAMQFQPCSLFYPPPGIQLFPNLIPLLVEAQQILGWNPSVFHFRF